MKNALIIGSTCVDVIIRIDHLPKTEENLHPDSQRFAVGGCAYNVANVLMRTGTDTTFVTPVGGRGVFGDFTRKALIALGAKDYVELPEAENGCCYCFVEKSGERTFMSIHGAEYTFDPAWMAPHAGKRFDYGYVCGLEIEERTGDALIDYLETAPVDTIVYAPGPRGAGIPKARTDRLLALRPMLHLNEGEALALSGESGLDAHRTARDRHPRREGGGLDRPGWPAYRAGRPLRRCRRYDRRGRRAHRRDTLRALPRDDARSRAGDGQPRERGRRLHQRRDALR